MSAAPLSRLTTVRPVGYHDLDLDHANVIILQRTITRRRTMLKRTHGWRHLFLAILLCLLALAPLGHVEARPVTASVSAADLAPFLKAKINWRQAAGQTINVGLTDEFDTDVLHKYLNDPKLTDPKWFNYNDLVPAFRDLGKWNGVTYALPEYIETSLVLYRKDLAQKAGITKAPATWQDFADDCRRMNQPPKVYGCAFDALKGSDQNVYRWTMVARAFGGNFFKDYPKDLTPVLNSPQNVAATQWYATTLQKYAPPGVANWGWYEVDSAGQQGKIAMEFESYDTALVLDDKSVSKTAGKWGVWPIPHGPGGTWPSAFSWLTAINAYSHHKVAAWLFMEFANSYASQVLKTTDQPFTDRTSIWSNNTIMAKWKGQDHGEWLPVVNQMFKVARADFRPRFTGWGQFGDRLSLAIQAAVAGKSAKAELDAAQQDALTMLRQGGYIQ